MKEIYLYKVSKEHNPSSEYEYTTSYLLWEETLEKAQKLAEQYLENDGYRWSEENMAFMHKDMDGGIRIEVEQVVILDVLNGPGIDMSHCLPHTLKYPVRLLDGDVDLGS